MFQLVLVLLFVGLYTIQYFRYSHLQYKMIWDIFSGTFFVFASFARDSRSLSCTRPPFRATKRNTLTTSLSSRAANSIDFRNEFKFEFSLFYQFKFEFSNFIFSSSSSSPVKICQVLSSLEKK